MRPRPGLPGGPYLVVGLARSGVAAALALQARGLQVAGVDAGDPEGAAQLRAAGVRSHCGEDGVRLLEDARAVVKSPGVPPTAPVLRAARELGIPVLGELELAWRMLSGEVIAITGTNGKTTTTELVAHVHRKAGAPVAVAGNVGTALSALALRGESKPPATIVCEASSFQLEDAVEFAPEAAVLLNLAPDHLDRHGNFAAYRAAKLSVFSRQREGDIAVLPCGLEVDLAALGGRAREVRFGAAPGAALQEREGALWWRGEQGPARRDSGRRQADGERLLAASELSLRGAHNRANAMAAAAVCLARGIDPAAVCAGLREFPGVPHRLEEVARRDGVLFVNDSKATNVASTLVALRAFGAGDGAAGAGTVHLILGGQGKRQDFRPLRREVARRCGGVYLIGEDAELIAAALAGIRPPPSACGDLEHAVAAATAAARPGDVVLLSPGCASFDQFRDFEERGERFRALAVDA